jgi:preprotein translocase subunit SecF
MQESTERVNYRFDFLKYRNIWLVISILYLLGGIALYFVKGGFRYHVDFTGGAEVRLMFENKMSIADLREAILQHGWKDATIQEVGPSGKEFLVRVGEGADSKIEQKLKADLKASFADNASTISNIEWVGAEVSKDTTWNAIKAVVLSLLILMLYIALRSEFSYGVGAVASLIHDVLAVLVFLLLVDVQISMHVLAAVLAILGYSLHDTIVIFNRIRENFKKLKGVSDYDIVNLSINQTLSRTILTSFATLLSVIAILLLGGESLRGMSLVIFIGIIVGTYSSIYIASPAMLIMHQRKHRKMQQQSA